MSEHLINVFIGFAIIILPITNIYYLAKLSTILAKFKTDNVEGS